MRLFILILLFITTSYILNAQTLEQPSATSASVRLKGFEHRQQLADQSIVNGVKFRNIGPTVFGGRITDLAVDPNDPTHFYAAYASGGLWETQNNGTRFTPLFDNQATMTIGDIAVDWKRDIIWVGTGENNSSRSSYSGTGIYRSDDGGKTWKRKGLEESHHIGRIIIDENNPDIVWVAVLGHLYSPNKERGIYKTVDGGETWKQVLFVDENSGGIDIVRDPLNDQVLYASTWHRERRAWNFIESGSGSLIHQSVDGGETWTVLSTPQSGFPNGNTVGRIGLAATVKNNKTLLYAIVDNYARRPKEEKNTDNKITKETFRSISRKDFLDIPIEALESFLKENGFPEKYTGEIVQNMVKNGSIEPVDLTHFLEDANSLMFDTPVIGAEVYVSENNGQAWTKTHEDYLDNVYYSFGYYFGQIRVDPNNPDKIYIFGVPVLRSEDGGKTFENINGDNVHVDHHALWINPKKSGHLILGNDGGVNISYDDGDSWYKCNVVPAGQFYALAVDMEKPYNVYGGLQDNGVWVGSSQTEINDAWHNTGRYPFQSIMGGDGMQIAIDPRDKNTVYTGYQYGFYYRLDRSQNTLKMIQPKHELGERPLRWNWQTPIHLSVHQPDILYMGSNFLHRSLNQGHNFTKISKDLTKGGQKGDVAYGTLTAIHESPLKFGLLYVGTDDGLVHITQDGGHTWTEITKGLPKDRWVTRVQASKYDLSTVYLTLNGYRWDDFNSYVYKSTNYGETWQRIGQNLPAEPVNVIKEDPFNPEILYLGTDHGLYVSLDRGNSFMLMNNGLPAVAVHDLVIHPREKELVVGTHGRSIYLADVEALELLTKTSKLNIFELPKIKYRSTWGAKPNYYAKNTPPKLAIPVYAEQAEKATIQVATASGVVVNRWKINLEKGLNYIEYNLTIDKEYIDDYQNDLEQLKRQKIEPSYTGKYYLQPMEYKVSIQTNTEKVTEIFTLEK